MKIVVALGGNALGTTPQEQKELVKHTAESIADLIAQKHDVIIVHGNGPQVGMIQSAFDEASKTKDNIPLMPLPECGAMSQGYIGFHLQNGIRNALVKRNLKKTVTTIVTQTVVDKNDPGFKNPTKPIGVFYSKAEAESLKAQMNLPYVDDSGRGYRFVVASPKPIDFLEIDSINALINQGHLIIASGGGGIPVIKENGTYEGVPAVIDKDASSAKLAEIIDADMLVILTAVDRVMINFGKPDQKALDKITFKEAKSYIEAGHFAAGSMLPKVEAALDFVTRKKDSKALIAALEHAAEAIEGKSGTTITYH